MPARKHLIDEACLMTRSFCLIEDVKIRNLDNRLFIHRLFVEFYFILHINFTFNFTFLYVLQFTPQNADNKEKISPIIA